MWAESHYPVSLRYSVLSKTKGFNSGAVPGEDYSFRLAAKIMLDVLTDGQMKEI